MKNDLVSRMNAEKQAAFAKGVEAGRMVQANLDAVALNVCKHFGKKQLEKLEVTAMALEIQNNINRDSEYFANQLIRRVQQIRGIDIFDKSSYTESMKKAQELVKQWETET